MPLTLLFQYLVHLSGGSIITAGIITGALCMALAFWSLFYMKETFSKDLDYTEEW